MNAKIIRILIHSLPDPTINRRLSVKKDQFPFICMISQLWHVIYNTNSYKNVPFMLHNIQECIWYTKPKCYFYTHLIYIKNKTMKTHFLLAGIAVLMLVAHNNKPASELTFPESGITVEVYTNEPGIQVYTDNFLPGQTYNRECIFKFSVEK